MNDNGNTEGTLRKKCPFLGQWCTGPDCAIYAELTQQTPFGLKKGGTCSLSALVMMISELNQKTQAPQQKLILPPIFKG